MQWIRVAEKKRFPRKQVVIAHHHCRYSGNLSFLDQNEKREQAQSHIFAPHHHGTVDCGKAVFDHYRWYCTVVALDRRARSGTDRLGKNAQRWHTRVPTEQCKYGKPVLLE